MARKNQHTFAKRQRELKKAEKLAEKKARRDRRKHPEHADGEPEDEPSLDDEETPSE